MAVRAAEERDLESVCSLLEDAFQRPDEARLFRSLWGSDDLATTLVEDDEGELAAVAVLSHLRSPDGALGLGPLAVARDRRDQGFGKAMIEASIAWARRHGRRAIFVLGQPRYYERFGFSVEAARPFESQWPSDYMMALELEPGALSGGGELNYPVPFSSLA